MASSPIITPGRILLVLLAFIAFLLGTLLYLEPSSPDLSAYRFTPFATDPEAEGEAAWSPDGRSVAYLKIVKGRRQVFMRSLESDSPVQITQVSADAAAPFWSPDSLRVWFLSAGNLWSCGLGGDPPELIRQGVRAAGLSPDGKTLAMWRNATDKAGRSFSLWLSSPPKSEPRKYLPAPFEVSGAFGSAMLRFSPDGKKILLSCFDEESPSLWLLPFPESDSVGDGPRRLFQKDAPWQYAPAFSWMPDNRHAVVSFEERSTSRSRLWLADTRHEILRPLTAGVAEESSPEVSPDGSRILFNSGGVDYDLVTVPLDGAPPQDLLTTSRREHTGAWVPGADQFVYISDRNGQEEMRMHDRGTGSDRLLISQRDFPDGATQILRDPVISFDGRFVAFDRKAVEGRRSIWVLPLSGGTPTRLTRNTGDEAVPTWSPDGLTLAYLMTEGGVLQLASSRLDGLHPPQTLVADISLTAAPEWSPTGEWIACANREGILLISPDGKRRRLLPRVRVTSLLWSRDGALIYVVSPQGNRGSQLLAMDVSSGAVKTVRSFTSDMVFSTGINPGPRLSMAADGKSFLASIRRIRTDLWILDGFNAPSGPRGWFLR